MSTTSVSPGAIARIRRGRRGALIVAIVLAAALLLAWIGRGASRGYLDPDAYNDAGSRAVAALLAEQDVEVVRVTRTADAVTALETGDGDGVTLLISIPDLLVPEQLDALTAAAPDSVVLVAPGDGPALAQWSAGVETAGVNSDEVLDPGCTWPAAAAAGRVDAGGTTYRVTSTDTGVTSFACYLIDDRASVVHQEFTSGRTLTVLGDSAVLRNDALEREGNAALALNALGVNPRIVWLLPSIGEATGGQQSFLDLAPKWVPFALLQLGFAVVLLALARARRFGRVVAEPLPAVVPGSETVEGRGRLYRRAGARDTAATALREGSRDRVMRRCGLPPGSQPDRVVEEAARRSGRNPSDVAMLLFGPPPATDAALIALATALRTLEKELP